MSRSTPKADAVNHPSHYNSGKIEVCEVIEDQGLGWGFCIGNAIKYLCRAGKKNPDKTIEDLEKAIWYIRRAIAQLVSKQTGKPIPKPDHMPQGRAR